MSPQELTAWIQVAQILINISVDVGGKLKALITTAHPTLSDAELNAAFDAVMAEDDVRAALSAKAAGG